MSDLETSLLSALLGFARDRVQRLVPELAPDPQTLLQSVLGYAPTASQVAELQTKSAEVQSHLTAASAKAASFGTKVAAPPASIAAAEDAVTDLAAVLSELDAAIAVIASVVPEVGAAEAALLKVLKRSSSEVSESLGGLAGQLQLLGAASKLSDGFSVSGTRITYSGANAAERALAGAGGASLALLQSSLSAWLDFGGAPVLGLTLKTGVRAGLALDGFLTALAQGGDAQIQVDLLVNLDSQNGVTFGAGVRNRIALPGQLSIPGLELRDLGLELPQPAELGGAASSGPGFDLTGTLAGQLAAIAATVDGAGLHIGIDPDKLGRDQSPVAIVAAAPIGAGLRVDAGPVAGGGYLMHSGDQYGGALDLRLGPIDIKAVGLVQTDPFSLVLVLSVEFEPAIQLSFGFTLNGVGGLLALERRLAADVLANDLSSGAADAILFPHDPVASAPTILRTLQDVFPAQSGGFVVGPMLELGWGVPVSFVTAKLGLIISLPDPLIALVGSLRVAVPDPDVPIVDLRAALLIEITPEKLLARVSLANSRIAGFSVSGDFGLLIGFADPQFALSAGGFYPGFQPPADLAGLRRITIDMSPPALLTLRAEAYVALTANSFQLGARVDLRADVGPVGAQGYIAFDAIVMWAPKFLFQADLTAGITLLALGESFAGVDLHLHLEGPGPWVARGSASISLLFVDVTLDIPTIQWGPDDNPPPPSVSPVDLVYDALGKDAAWAAQLPADVDMLVRLRDDPAAGLLVHPLGAFELRQKAVPLETTIDRVGRNPAAPNRVNLGQPRVGAADAKAVSAVTDLFAPGQYLNLTDDQKLARPAFEPFPSGARLAGADGDVHGTPVETQYQWDTVYPHEPGLAGTFDRARLPSHVASVVLHTSAAGKFERAAGNPYHGPGDPITLADPGQATIRRVRDLTADPAASAAFTTTTEAARALADLTTANPELAGSLQLVGIGAAP